MDVELSFGVALSVRPEYAAAIVAGVKRVKFRRKRIHVPASHAIFYAAAPEKWLVCVCKAFYCWVDWAALDALRARCGELGGISREEFDAYYEGCEEDLAIDYSE